MVFQKMFLSRIRTQNQDILDLESEIEREKRIDVTFPIITQRPGKKKDFYKICPSDLQYVLQKINAPKSYRKLYKDAIWECDEKMKGHISRKRLKRAYKRAYNDAKRRRVDCTRPLFKENCLLVDVVDFVSKDSKMTGYISLKECMVLVLNRFGGKVLSEKLKSLIMSNPGVVEKRTISFSQYLKQMEIRNCLKM